MVTPTGTTTFMLPSDREIVMSRFLEAPRDLVWKAWMDLADAERSVAGRYVEVVKPERIVRIFGVEGALESKVVIETVTFRGPRAAHKSDRSFPLRLEGAS